MGELDEDDDGGGDAAAANERRRRNMCALRFSYTDTAMPCHTHNP